MDKNIGKDILAQRAKDVESENLINTLIKVTSTFH